MIFAEGREKVLRVLCESELAVMLDGHCMYLPQGRCISQHQFLTKKYTLVRDSDAA
jgi:hypothetical protein